MDGKNGNSRPPCSIFRHGTPKTDMRNTPKCSSHYRADKSRYILVGNLARTESIHSVPDVSPRKCQSAKCRVQKYIRIYISGDAFRRASGKPTRRSRHLNRFNKKLIICGFGEIAYLTVHSFVLDCFGSATLK